MLFKELFLALMRFYKYKRLQRGAAFYCIYRCVLLIYCNFLCWHLCNLATFNS